VDFGLSHGACSANDQQVSGTLSRASFGELRCLRHLKRTKKQKLLATGSCIQEIIVSLCAFALVLVICAVKVMCCYKRTS